MYWVVHPRRPRDFLRPERCPGGEARGTSRGPREISRLEGMCIVQPNTSQLEACTSSIINPYQGMYQEIHPCRAGSIGIVEINTSLMMGECSIFTWLTCCFHKTINKCQNLTYHMSVTSPHIRRDLVKHPSFNVSIRMM